MICFRYSPQQDFTTLGHRKEEICRYLKEKGYLFSWDNISGNDNGRLIEFLNRHFGIEWIKTAKIEKIDGDRTINVSTEKNFLSLRLDDEKTKVNIKIDDGRTEELITQAENGKLNIYEKDEKGVTSYSELKVKFNPRTLGKHLKELIEKEIIIKTESGKYQLTKEVRVERSRHLYKQFTFDGTAQNNYIEYYNIEELPEHLKNSLLISPNIRLDFVKNPHLPIQIQEKIFRHLFQ